MYVYIYIYVWDKWWRSCFRQRDTSRKVAGSIPDGVIGFFFVGVDWASNRNEYQEYFLWVKAASV
jgi:hypothetical protein